MGDCQGSSSQSKQMERQCQNLIMYLMAWKDIGIGRNVISLHLLIQGQFVNLQILNKSTDLLKHGRCSWWKTYPSKESLVFIIWLYNKNFNEKAISEFPPSSRVFVRNHSYEMRFDHSFIFMQIKHIFI